jgi:uncharacterized protein
MIRRGCIAVLCAALSAPAAAAPRGRMPVRSLVELRRDHVVRQGWDLSCGAAALGTVLTYEHGDPVTEGQIVAGLLQKADLERIRKRGGFSFLDLKRFAVDRGYQVLGYKQLRLDTLLPLAPAIVPTLARGEPHFMVFRGIERDRVLLADPAFGNRTMPRAGFEALWTPRVAFVVRGPTEAPRDAEAGAPRPVVPSPQVIRTAREALR